MWKSLTNCVTFKDFSRLMKRRGYSVDDLVSLFHGKLEENRAFFDRVVNCNKLNEAVAIPYRSVLKFYIQEKESETLKKQQIG